MLCDCHLYIFDFTSIFPQCCSSGQVQDTSGSDWQKHVISWFRVPLVCFSLQLKQWSLCLLNWKQDRHLLTVQPNHHLTTENKGTKAITLSHRCLLLFKKQDCDTCSVFKMYLVFNSLNVFLTLKIDEEETKILEKIKVT